MIERTHLSSQTIEAPVSAPPLESTETSADVPRTLFVLIAISGMSGLMYEIIWIRALGLHFGTSTPAVTTVVATFMAGLGLGNALLGSRADRASKPLSMYRRIEFGIAFSGLLVSLLVLRAGTVMDEISRLCAALGPFALLGNALVLALIIMLPCTLMGGTLPVLSRAFVRQGHAGRAVGALYVGNTLGALAGALLPDFFLISRFGLTATAIVAACGNLTVAMAFSRLALMHQASVPPPRDSTSDVRVWRVPPAAWVLTAISGLAGMALEVLWSRTLSHWTIGLATSFSVLLAVYLIMLAVGATLTRSLADRCNQPLGLAAGILSLSGVAALLPILFAPSWRILEHHLWPRPAGVVRPGLLFQAVDALLHATYLEAGACVLMGAAFPFVAAAMVREGVAGTNTGRLFTVNTLAGTAGALIAGFFLLPALGEQNSYLAVIFVIVLASAAAMIPVRAGSAGRAALGLGSLVLVLLAMIAVPKGRLSRTHFEGASHIIALREGTTTTAAVSEHMAYGQLHWLELLTPGVSMSDTSFSARRYMGMMAHVAMLAAEKQDRALLICYGTGNSASSLLSYPELKRLDVVDIAPEVFDLARYFARIRGSNPLADARVRKMVEDGRHHLIVDDTNYDVITLEPPPPNHAGVANLYSREFYQLAGQRLSRGGVITQWLPVFQLSQTDTLAIISAFVAEMPHTALLYGINRQFILIGSQRPLAIDPVEGSRRAAMATVAANMSKCGINGLPDIYGSVLQTDTELRSLVANATPVTDDRPSIQYPWQRIVHLPDYAAWFGNNPDRYRALVAGKIEPSLERSIATSVFVTNCALAVVHEAEQGSPERRELVVGNAVRLGLARRPDDESLLSMLSLQSDRVALAQHALTGSEPRVSSENKGTSSESQAVSDAEWTLGRLAFYSRDYRKALTLLSRIEPRPSESARHALIVGGCERALGRPAQAALEFQKAASSSRDDVFQKAARQLAQQAAKPFPPNKGPLAPP
jgi:spermidine synthase